MKSENEKLSLLLRGAAIVTLITLSAVLRIVPHPWNLTPVGAMALFSGAMFRNRWIAFLLPLASLFAGDLFVGFHNSCLSCTRALRSAWPLADGSAKTDR